MSRRVLAGLCGTALVALAILGDGPGRVARFALDLGWPDLATWMLRDAGGGAELLLRADARLASGDTAGAVLDYVGASEAAMPSGRVAWDAGERLARLHGKDDAAAEALLRAYVLGIEPERWGIVAEALERAGRSDEARRVRERTGR